MTSPRALAARKDSIEKANAIGVTPAYISTLVDTFYDRIREHDVLGPIFNTAIGDDWDPHLRRMKAFWASVTLSAGLYSGKPVPAHRKHLNMIEREHFEIWLSLFKQTLEDTAPTTACTDYFMVRAERIAKSLQLAMFGIPGLGPPQYSDKN